MLINSNSKDNYLILKIYKTNSLMKIFLTLSKSVASNLITFVPIPIKYILFMSIPLLPYKKKLSPGKRKLNILNNANYGLSSNLVLML